MSDHQEDEMSSTSADALARFERARRVNSKCAAKELAIRDELKHIEQRKIELATMRKMNGGQRNVWLDELIETTIIPYSRAWNRSFAQQLQAALPPEIRSIVCRYVMDPDTWEEYENDFYAVTSVLPPEIGHCSCLREHHGMPRVPHFLLPEYMGSETAAEFVSNLYASDWFEERTLYGKTAGLEDLVHKDAFGAGFDPVSHIRSLRLICLVDDYRLPRSRPSKDDREHAQNLRKYLDRDRLKSDFDQLLGVADNKGFLDLEVTFVQRNVRIDVLEEALDSFTDVFNAFKEPAVDLRVQWRYYSFTCGNRVGHAHERSLKKFFTQPRLTWKFRMLQFLEQLKPCMKTQHIKFINEPGHGLSDADFVDRMWDAGESFYPTEYESDEEDDCESLYDTDSVPSRSIRQLAGFPLSRLEA